MNSWAHGMERKPVGEKCYRVNGLHLLGLVLSFHFLLIQAKFSHGGTLEYCRSDSHETKD